MSRRPSPRPSFPTMQQMSRWVECNGQDVTFGNVVGAFCGTPYHYRCATPEEAQRFADYLTQRDATGSPVAVTDEIRAQYGAVEASKESK